MEQVGIEKYLPLTLEKMEEMRGMKFVLPKTREALSALLQMAFVMGYTRGESDCIKEYVSKLRIQKQYQNDRSRDC